MSKEMREFLDKLAGLKGKAKELRAKDGVTVDEISAITDEIRTVNAQIELLMLEEAENSVTPAGSLEVNTPSNRTDDELYSDAFFNAIQNRPLSESEASILTTRSALSSGTGEDGGYIIPNDEQTAINELKREYTSLEQYVNVEPVSTNSGSRVIEKDADSTPFIEFAEGDDVPASDAPKFVKVLYAIKDRGGILPIPANLLKDTKENLKKYLRKWLAKKQVATRNSLILAVLSTVAKTPITGFDDVKGILNKVLDPAISKGAKIFTNQDGFNYLDTLKDDNGAYIMKPDVTDPTKQAIKGREVVVLSNKVLPTRDVAGTDKAPIIIGDLKEAITLFDREQMSLLSTNIGGDAFLKNRTDTRAITREDVKMVDSEAVAYGEVIIA